MGAKTFKWAGSNEKDCCCLCTPQKIFDGGAWPTSVNAELTGNSQYAFGDEPLGLWYYGAGWSTPGSYFYNYEEYVPNDIWTPGDLPFVGHSYGIFVPSSTGDLGTCGGYGVQGSNWLYYILEDHTGTYHCGHYEGETFTGPCAVMYNKRRGGYQPLTRYYTTDPTAGAPPPPPPTNIGHIGPPSSYGSEDTYRLDTASCQVTFGMLTNGRRVAFAIYGNVFSPGDFGMADLGFDPIDPAGTYNIPIRFGKPYVSYRDPKPTDPYYANGIAFAYRWGACSRAPGTLVVTCTP